MPKLSLDLFERRDGEHVFTSPAQKSFAYSDGDAAEQRMFSIVSNATDLSLFSRELREAIVDWPTEYHLSARRANIIRPLTELGPGVRVLELGCGCGAITRALAETGAAVDAVEGSPRRAAIAAERVRDLDNARVHVSNFQDIEFESKYDIVTLIGVLEYAPVYLDSHNPFVSCLEMAKSALKPGGKIVIAIENQLGLKYFSGISEDHFSIPYYGIEGRYKSRQITTYGKKRLSAFLCEAGLPAHEFLYPFPDYKLPEVILAEKALNHPHFNAADLVSPLENRDYSLIGSPHFNIGLAWDAVAEEGLLGELSNSFLVIASPGSSTKLINHDWLALKITDNRAPEFTSLTHFLEQENTITVSKTRLIPAPDTRTSIATFSPGDEKYIFGKNALSVLKRALITGDSDKFVTILRLWIDALKAQGVQRNWIDATPANFIIDQSTNLHFIDREWQALFDFDWTLPAQRGFLSLITDEAIASRIPGDTQQEKQRFLHLCTDVLIPKETLAQADYVSKAFWKEVYGNGTWRSIQRNPVQGKRDNAQSPQNARAPSHSVRSIAFYLPQFHSIPENNAWWGNGFTEWDNVRQGKPLFDGHYQPHEPGELGYYDLSDAAILDKQAKLAKLYGLEGFCFYHYWFDGKRLLEKPVDLLLAHPEIDLPFCLCWANENWTRRWDGGEQEILIAQSYDQNSHERFACDLLPYLRDPRYIRVDGKPLILIYRADIIPSLPDTLAAWRTIWHREGIGDVYLACIESFTTRIPQDDGFDAACEFFPHQIDFSRLWPDERPSHPSDPQAKVADYNKLVDAVQARPQPGYKRFRGVIPSWDNSARRRKGGASLFINATPERYEAWLKSISCQTMVDFDGDERLVFINAWNEWGEGCHLEPDQKYGRSWLEATKRALQASEQFDVHYARHVKPYHNWLDLHQPSEETVKRHTAPGTTSVRFIVAVDATHSAPEQLAATLGSYAEQQSDALQLVVVASFPAPSQNPPGILWLESAVFPDILMLEFAKANPETWLCQIRAGDLFSKSGLNLLANALQEKGKAMMAYADEDTLDSRYGPTNPQFRPDFDIDHLRSYPYIGRFLFIRGQELIELGGSDCHYGLAAPYDLALRFFERYGKEGILHLPEILFHGLAENLDREALTLHQEALAAHLRRTGISAQISAGRYPGSFYIQYQHESTPLVTIIIPTKNKIELLQRCLESLIEKTRYGQYEVLIVDNQSTEASALQYLQGLRELNAPNIRILDYPHPFNFSAINNLAARESRGEYLVLLNNDTAIIQPDWLEALLNHAQRPEVGIVGAKLLYPNGTIQHAGVILGLRGPADHPFIGEAMDAPGYFGHLLLDQQCSAVTAACLMIRKSIYQQAGGMDEDNFKVSYNDVDLCLKIREQNYSVVWTPRAIVMHEGNVSQNSVMESSQPEKILRFEAEQDCMYQKWMSQLEADPFYNRNLSLSFSGFELELDPLLCRPVVRDDRPTVLAVNADTAGSGHYRVIEPVAAMKSAGLIQRESGNDYLSPVLLRRVAPEVIILQRQYTDEQLALMVRCRQFSRARMIYELDDFLPNLPVANAHRGDFPKDIGDRIKKAAALCDRVVVSTDTLKSALSELHSDIVVLPNYLPPAWWGKIIQRSPTRREGKPRLGWAGGISHAGDLRLIADVVKALADQVDWVFFGMKPEGVDSCISEYHPGVDIMHYPEYLASLDLDLALAPLEINPFNACKSNLRILEYGACGYPVIATDIDSYRCGLPVTLIENKARLWMDTILKKLADRKALQCEAEALQKAIRDNWMLEGENLTRWQRGWTLNQSKS